MGKWRRAQDMAAPVLTISFSTSASRVDVGDFFLDIQSMATSPINSKPPKPNPRPSPSASESFDDFFFFLEPPPPPSAGAALGPGPQGVSESLLNLSSSPARWCSMVRVNASMCACPT